MPEFPRLTFAETIERLDARMVGRDVTVLVRAGVATESPVIAEFSGTLRRFDYEAMRAELASFKADIERGGVLGGVSEIVADPSEPSPDLFLLEGGGREHRIWIHPERFKGAGMGPVGFMIDLGEVCLSIYE